MSMDPFGEGGRYLGKAAVETQKDMIGAFRLLLRLLFFPIWLPAFLFSKRRRRHRQVEFAEDLIRDGITDHSQIALGWVETHPEEYLAFPRIQRTFRKIVQRRVGRPRSFRHRPSR